MMARFLRGFWLPPTASLSVAIRAVTVRSRWLTPGSRAWRSPEVSIGAARDGAMWRVWVRDNGIGMKAEDAERIFQPFKRLHGEEAYPGTGIGLAICERIVSQHGGRIWVTSTPGEGSTFLFTLPLETTEQ